MGSNLKLHQHSHRQRSRLDTPGFRGGEQEKVLERNLEVGFVEGLASLVRDLRSTEVVQVRKVWWRLIKCMQDCINWLLKRGHPVGYKAEWENGIRFPRENISQNFKLFVYLNKAITSCFLTSPLSYLPGVRIHQWQSQRKAFLATTID